MTRDRAQRVTMARIDDEKRQFMIDTARRLIYRKNYLVHGAAVEDLLKPTSLVPTAVRPYTLSVIYCLITKSIRMYSPRD